MLFEMKIAGLLSFCPIFKDIIVDLSCLMISRIYLRRILRLWIQLVFIKLGINSIFIFEIIVFANDLFKLSQFFHSFEKNINYF